MRRGGSLWQPVTAVQSTAKCGLARDEAVVEAVAALWAAGVRYHLLARSGADRDGGCSLPLPLSFAFSLLPIYMP